MVEVWSISNKSYSRNVMIDTKVILHDIFYNTSNEFPCTYPLLYTAGMCVVTYIGVYNTYLSGTCFLSTLYNDIICATPPQSKLLFVSVSSHGYATSQNNFIHTNVTLPAEIPRAPCLLVQWIHVTLLLFSFGRPMLWMLYFQSTGLGCSWTWSAPWNATSCHIFLLRMDNQFANENFTEIFVHHFAATWLVYKKCT